MPLAHYLHSALDDLLRKRRVVVWYDADREFTPFIEALAAPGSADADGAPGKVFPTVTLGKTTAKLAVYAGSFFSLRLDTEPLVAAPKPDPLLIYVPGEKPDEKGSPLKELECAGALYQPSLKRVAKQLLSQRFTDGVIDDLLRDKPRTYAEITALLMPDAEGAASSGSVLKLVFEKQAADPAGMLARWLAEPDTDSAIDAKGGAQELLKLIASRTGLTLDPGTPLLAARHRFARYLFLNEFRHDLRCAPPPAIGAVPVAESKPHRDFGSRVLDLLRTRHADAFEPLSDEIEKDFALGHLGIRAEDLGAIDTFRFEEVAMLRRVDELIAAGNYATATAETALHRESFWAKRDMTARQIQWEICARLAELGTRLDLTEAALKKTAKADAATFAENYAAPDGWHLADRLHRQLEEVISRMTSEPEAEKALALLRARVESLLRDQAETFAAAFAKSALTLSGVLPQTHIYPKKVAPQPGKVAWFMVDALRYEMGAELAGQLPEALDRELTPAAAVLPSITPLGMAALLPGADTDFAVVAHKGKVAARIGNAVLPDAAERMKHLKAKIPDAADILLADLLHRPPSKIEERINGARLLVVRSQEIDELGETSEIIARQGMGMIIQNLVRAVRKLAGMGYERFIITADHGHQFATLKTDDMKVDAPAGDTLELHRRCWIGRGPSVPTGTMRVSAQDLGYAAPMDFVFPQGAGVFKAGGGLAYHHGGFSLQEILIPVLSFRMPNAVGKGKSSAGREIRLAVPFDKITNRMFAVKLELMSDFTQPEPARVRVMLISKDEAVGTAGMASGALLDRASQVLTLEPGKIAEVGLWLKADGVDSLQIVVQDAASAAIYAQSAKLAVKVNH